MTIVNAENKLANIFYHQTHSNQLNLNYSFLFSRDVNNFLINLEKISFIVRVKVHRKFY